MTRFVLAALGSGGWGKGGDQSQAVQLHDLATDIAESKNLAADDPDRVTGMQALLEELIANRRSRPGAVQMNDVAVKRFPVPPEAVKNTAFNRVIQ